MPHPDEIVPQAPEGSPYGTEAGLQRQAKAAPMKREVAPPPVMPEMAPFPPEAPQFTGDLNGPGMDQILFNSPTQRPDEPVTTGSPFGPGANFVPGSDESPTDFMARVSQAITSSPAATARTKEYADRINRGG